MVVVCDPAPAPVPAVLSTAPMLSWLSVHALGTTTSLLSLKPSEVPPSLFRLTNIGETKMSVPVSALSLKQGTSARPVGSL